MEAHATPSNPAFTCPLVTLCDAPVFTKLCVHGGRSAPGPVLAVPSNPSPANGATEVPVATSLGWNRTGFEFCCGLGTAYTVVHFGTSPAPPFVHRYEDLVFAHDPGVLSPRTTYYWSVGASPDHDCGAASGGVWSFTTGDAVGVQAVTWDAVKSMFR